MSLKSSLTSQKSKLETVKSEIQGDKQEVELVVSDRIQTEEEAIAKSGIDPALWKVDKLVINSYESLFKDAGGHGHIVPLWQIKLTLSRKAPKEIQEGIELLLKDVRRVKRSSTTYKSGSCLAELALYDAHFGNLAFGAVESLQDQVDKYVWAVEALIKRAKSEGPERIVFPIGHDTLHFDNWKKQTAKGTQLEALCESLPTVFDAAEAAIRNSIVSALKVAPVEVILIRGNHDPTTSYYLCKVLEARFENVDNVSFDLGEESRKYRKYGVNMFGYTHGDDINKNNLPLTMAAEEPMMWGNTKFRNIRTGHTHTRKQVSFSVGDEDKGVRIDTLPAICSTNEWHHRRGYIGNVRAGELWLWDRNEGYMGHFSKPVVE